MELSIFPIFVMFTKCLTRCPAVHTGPRLVPALTFLLLLLRPFFLRPRPCLGHTLQAPPGLPLGPDPFTRLSGREARGCPTGPSDSTPPSSTSVPAAHLHCLSCRCTCITSHSSQ